MVGRGSVNPKSRKFYAKNTAQECSHLDITYFEEISRQCTMNSLTRLWSDTTPSRSGQTARLRTTTRRYADVYKRQRSHRMKFCVQKGLGGVALNKQTAGNVSVY